MVEELIKHQAKANHQDKLGQTALIIATEKGNLDMVKRLLEHQVDVQIKDKNGRTALDKAQTKGHTEIVTELRKAEQNK